MRDYDAWRAWLDQMQEQPFAWGSNDCVTFAAGAVRALTGMDPLRGIGAWKSEVGALRALKRRGGLVAAVSSVLTPVPASMAQRGDIGAVEGPRGPLLVVIEGLTLAGPGIDGIERIGCDRLTQAWSAT